MSTVPDDLPGPEQEYESDDSQEEKETALAPQPTGRGNTTAKDKDRRLGSPESRSFNGYTRKSYNLQEGGIDSPPSSRNGHERPSSADGSFSIPDDTLSAPGSLTSSPIGQGRAESYSQSPTPSLRPFDRRFQARLSSSQLSTPRASSPAFLTSHSRNSSAAWTLQDGRDTEVEIPWEVVRWTKLKKMTGQAFSEVGKRNFGRPTCIAVSASIVLGTSRGILLLFDYNQNIKCIMGPGTKAIEAGAVTSVSISADHTTVAGGHASGSIFTWEIAKPGKPFLHIPPLDRIRNPNADGHVLDAAVLHLGFLGIRHTALSSADDKGMAFSHLATRGMGMVARTVKTTRVLGRYPDKSANAAPSRKPSSVLAFSPLPLGNVEHVADGMGLVAMLTPYLLVVVSTMPLAQTQFKSPRPKEVASHSAMTGAVAWFPSVRLKVPSTDGNESSSKAKLVYCWSNVLTVLDVIEIEPSDSSNKAEPPSLQFKPRSRWKAEEAIVGVQWLSRSVLAVLTITQQLVILEDYTMLVTDSSDLLYKHIYHTDLFSQQLNQLVDQLDDDEVASMHGVVADAFYMSFRAYKGRLFLLGHSEVSFGTLSNWADRLHALVEDGSYIRAIKLGTDYYTGEADRVTVGLPEGDSARHQLVREKLLPLILASLTFAFGTQSKKLSTHELRQHLDDLAQACIDGCISTEEHDFLFDDVYPWYKENHVGPLFLGNLEPGINGGDIKVLPAEVIKDLVNHYTSKGMSSRLEEMLCLLDPRTLDIDQVTSLCRSHHLYDALLYVWNQALGDYTTILGELLQQSLPQPNGNANIDGVQAAEGAGDTLKIFPYLSYILTGRSYPMGEAMSDDQAILAKAEIYDFFFTGKGKDGLPRGDLSPPSSKSAGQNSFRNLRNILRFDAPSFMSMMNEAFEDSFLNGPQERLGNERPGSLTEAQKIGLSINRQWIMSILLDVMTPPKYGLDDIIYLDMFIARNLPKFPQFILLSGHILQRVLVELCQYPNDDLAEDCQLSVEYLLSMYQPPDLNALVPMLQQARFFRVLKSIFKGEKQYAKLLQTCFDDHEQQDEVYECIVDCLGPTSSLTRNQREEVRSVITERARDLVTLDVIKTATTINQCAPDLHGTMIATIVADRSRQYHYLEMVLEPESKQDEEEPDNQLSRIYVEMYVRLMCEFNPSHVSSYIDGLKTGDLRLDEVLPSLEDGGVIDAAVVLLAREGKVREGIDRLTKHMHFLESALSGLFGGLGENAQSATQINSAQSIIESLQKYSRVGAWICQGQTRTAARNRPSLPRKKSSIALAEHLSADEEMWLDVIDSTVTVVKNATEVLEQLDVSFSGDDNRSSDIDTSQLISALRTIVQETFTALLTTTTVPRESESNRHDLSFLRILRAFLTRASLSSPSLSNLRGVLGAIFSAYSYEEELLSLSNKLLDKDLFVHVNEADKLRRRGWRPLGWDCEGCNKRVWGPGAGSQVWDEFQRSNEERSIARKESRVGSFNEDADASRSATGAPNRGKGKAVTSSDREGEIAIPETATQDSKADYGLGSGPIVVFACRHMFHKSCLENMRGGGDKEGNEQQNGIGGRRFELVCPLCTESE